MDLYNYDPSEGINSSYMTQVLHAAVETNQTTEQDITTAMTSLVYSTYAAVIIAILLSILTIGCIMGNTLVIVAVLVVAKLKTPSNYLIVSLAVSDWLVGIIVMPLSIIYELTGRWTLGAKACNMWVTFDVMLCTASILNLMMISIDRYLVITRPFRYSQKRTAKLMMMYIGIAWSVSLVISVTPMVVGWHTESNGRQCIINQEIGYQVYATLAAFYLPLTVMIALYGRIFFISSRIAKAEAKNNPSFISVEKESTAMIASPTIVAEEMEREGSRSKTVETELTDIGNHDLIYNNGHTTPENGLLHNNNVHSNGSSHNSESPANLTTESKTRKSFLITTYKMSIGRLTFKKAGRRRSASNSQAIMTLGVIMGLFTACWLPFFILAVVRSICMESCNIPVWVTSFLTWLGYVNSCLNPVIYARFNREFRTPFKEILCCRCHKLNESVRQIEYLYRYGE